jgi:glycosyltransferase involved in cell wall biosynthesis
MLLKLISHLPRDRFDATVFSLTNIGPVGEMLRDIGITVQALGMIPDRPNPVKLVALSGWLRQGRFDLVQTWMYHADLIGAMAAKLAGNLPVIWGIHHSDLNPASTKRSTLLVAKICARISNVLPDAILSPSYKGIETHAEIGYSRKKMHRIPNGFDLKQFQPDFVMRMAERKRLGLAESTPLVGIVGRFHPIKDIASFIKAAGIMSGSMATVQFVLCGDGLTWKNGDLAGWIREAGIGDKCHLLGKRNDICRVMNAFDVFVSSSRGESFPLVIGEAMACGVPCVVTDVGDSALIVGDTGFVVPAQNPEALAGGIVTMLTKSHEEHQRLGAAARSRIMDNYSLTVIVKQYEELYQSVLEKRQCASELIRRRV